MADYVVVGGGVHGSAVAWGLAREGASVTLVERNTVACGASGGPGKRGVRANGRDPRELPLMRIAYDIWPSLSERLGGDTGYERRGGMELAEAATVDDEIAWSAVLARQRVQQALGVPTDVLTPDEARRLEPGLADEVRAALYCPLDGIADHTATTRAYANAATSAGAEIRERTPVTAVTSTDDGAHVALADGSTLTARRGVFVLVNSYARELLAESFGLHLPVWRMQPQVMLVRARDGYRPDHLVGHFTRRLAVKVLPDGLIMISGGRRGDWDVAGDVGVADQGEASANLADAAAVIPALADAEIVDVDASRPESCAVDDVPVVDLVPGTANVWFGTGWSGHGFAIAPAVAESLVAWARAGTRPSVLEPFRLTRWQAAAAA